MAGFGELQLIEQPGRFLNGIEAPARQGRLGTPSGLPPRRLIGWTQRRLSIVHLSVSDIFETGRLGSLHPTPPPLPIAMRIRTFVVTSFLGLAGTGFAQQTDFGFTAFSGGNAGTPDPDLAVGPTHIVGVANFAVKVFDKQGNELQSVSLKDFFGSTTGTVFDPVALWDPHSGRYLIAAAEHEPLPFASPTDYLDVAVSAGTSPIGPSHRYRFNIIMDCDYVEYLNLGVNEEAVYASADCVNFGGANCWVLDKVELLQGLPLVPTKISLSGGSPAILGNTKNFDPGSPAQYLVSTITTSQMVTLYAVVDPLGAATVSTRILNVPTWAEPPDAEPATMPDAP